MNQNKIRKFNKNNINKIVYRILKIIFPVILIFFLFKNSYISLQQLELIFTENKLNLFNNILLSITLSLMLYLRWMLCINIYDIKINFLSLIRVSSAAYSLASFIPGQLGIDLLRIGKLRKSDSTKYKTKLLKATLIEKIFALLGQLYILISFLLKGLFFKIIFLILCILTINIFFNLTNNLKRKNYLKKYLKNINQKNIFINFFYSILCNYVSCYLIFNIAHSLKLNLPFNIVAISSTVSNISSVIPVSPNGLGLAEFIFSEVTQNISNLNNGESVATIYFSYRIFLLLSHFFIFYLSQSFIFKEKNINV